MGEPFNPDPDGIGKLSAPTEAERAATLEIARAIVEAERNDEESPLAGPIDLGDPTEDASHPLGPVVFVLRAWLKEVDLQTFRLSQDLVTATAERDAAEQNIAAWLIVQAELMHPHLDRSAIKVLRQLAADVRSSKWSRQPKVADRG